MTSPGESPSDDLDRFRPLVEEAISAFASNPIYAIRIIREALDLHLERQQEQVSVDSK